MNIIYIFNEYIEHVNSYYTDKYGFIGNACLLTKTYRIRSSRVSAVSTVRCVVDGF